MALTHEELAVELKEHMPILRGRTHPYRQQVHLQ
jgi:hypothetical protein